MQQTEAQKNFKVSEWEVVEPREPMDEIKLPNMWEILRDRK